MSEIIEKTESFATDLLTNDLDSKYLYHNLTHTRRVVKSSKEIINYRNLNAKDSETLIMAAWLHDTGYTKGSEGHEEKSCAIAKDFLEKQGYRADGIKEVLDIIMATKRYYIPKTVKEQIIRDADACHFGQKSYMETCELLRTELSILGIADTLQKNG